MKTDLTLSDDFCRIPPAKVFLLSIATFGLFLVYWYEIQYAKSKKVARSVFKDFLKSYFFVCCSFKLSEKINRLLGNKDHELKLTRNSFFIAKFVVIIALEAIFYALYSIHVFLIATLILEAAYATMLQTVINDYIPQLHDTKQPWQRFELFHLVVLVGGLSLVLFFQFSDDPFGIFRK
jgi:hypothetical protein